MPGTRSKTNAKVIASKLEDATIESIAKYIQQNKVKNIVVMTGAGISTAAGIPDFRSKNTGLYDNLQKFDLPYAEAIFDIDYFQERPEPFYALAKELYPGKYLPTKTHYFIRLLHDKNMLLRNFTQNIDTLERICGLDEDRIVEAHGSFASASCIQCDEKADMEEIRSQILLSKIPRCLACKSLIKPDITFFGESLPKRFFKRLVDFDEADLLIVIGTSLQVQPFAALIDNVPEHTPRLLINKDLAGVHHSPHHGFDFKWKYGKKRDSVYLGDCDEGIEKLAELLGWKNELDRLYEKETKKLKERWATEKVLEQEQEELEKLELTEEKPDKEIDQLAEELEKRLKVPSDKE
ncbi:DHS-like NAD/FAD-binding domain-containing protein [Halteromyces radiatus]|uniref:DHS-like NAD/FAD-binding domain-containing protein n=1 Tax=Halteromyces radiatus TaxID=101107 RepID=UPI00221E56CB|nr:DHS-like NAD/FAD-binding domain-containing protein [Halteromyces radiatus]KAI8096864.1 DHS-like NAD/FAD-binding domain-containing protein [Halteromyces radiatus]